MEPTLVDDPAARRFRLVSGDEELGYIDYDPIGERTRLLKHTEVDPKHEGKGYGGRLVKGFLDDLRARGMNVIPICPYAMACLKRHREYVDVVREDARGTIWGSEP